MATFSAKIALFLWQIQGFLAMLARDFSLFRMTRPVVIEDLNDLNAALALRPNEPRFYILRGGIFTKLGYIAAAAADNERVRMLSGK